MKNPDHSSWFVHIQCRSILEKYSLPSAHDIIRDVPTKHLWGQTVKDAVYIYWKNKWQEEVLILNVFKTVARPFNGRNTITTTTMATAGCFKVGPGGDNPDYDINKIHTEILDVLESILKYRSYDDLIFADCDGHRPRNFSSVDVSYAERKRKFGVLLGDLYNTNVIEQFGQKMPGPVEYMSLINFLKDSDKDTEALLKVFDSNPDETSVTAVLAVHLFAKLAPDSVVIMDKYMNELAKLSGKCPCKCNGTFEIGGIGIGSSEVWHGYPDIQVATVMVKVVWEEPEPDSSEDEDNSNTSSAPSPAKIRKNEKTIGNTKECREGSTEAAIRQVLAQTITNSFAQAAVNDQLRKKFVTSILCSPKGIQVFAYNVEHDFLLCTVKPLNILETDKDGNKKICVSAVLEIWFALHVHLFGCNADSFAASGDRMGLSKCGFQELMNKNDCLNFYMNAKRNVKVFQEKVKLKFQDAVITPFATTYLKPFR